MLAISLLVKLKARFIVWTVHGLHTNTGTHISTHQYGELGQNNDCTCIYNTFARNYCHLQTSTLFVLVSGFCIACQSSKSYCINFVEFIYKFTVFEVIWFSV